MRSRFAVVALASILGTLAACSSSARARAPRSRRARPAAPRRRVDAATPRRCRRCRRSPASPNIRTRAGCPPRSPSCPAGATTARWSCGPRCARAASCRRRAGPRCAARRCASRRATTPTRAAGWSNAWRCSPRIGRGRGDRPGHRLFRAAGRGPPQARRRVPHAAVGPAGRLRAAQADLDAPGDRHVARGAGFACEGARSHGSPTRWTRCSMQVQGSGRLHIVEADGSDRWCGWRSPATTSSRTGRWGAGWSTRASSS